MKCLFVYIIVAMGTKFILTEKYIIDKYCLFFNLLITVFF
jgi:hypothetical protein